MQRSVHVMCTQIIQGALYTAGFTQYINKSVRVTEGILQASIIYPCMLHGIIIRRLRAMHDYLPYVIE